MSAAMSRAVPVRQSHWPIYLMVFGITVMWSANFICREIRGGGEPAVLAMGLPYLAAGLLMVPIFTSSGRSARGETLLRADFWTWWRSAGGVTLNQLFFTLAMEHTSVAHGSLIISTTPIPCCCWRA